MTEREIFYDAFLRKYPSASLANARDAWASLTTQQKRLIMRGRVLKRRSSTRYRRGRGRGGRVKKSTKRRKRWSKVKKGLLGATAALGALGTLYGAHNLYRQAQGSKVDLDSYYDTTVEGLHEVDSDVDSN